jgi:uncharacterized protein (TIGR02466 family)
MKWQVEPSYKSLAMIAQLSAAAIARDPRSTGARRTQIFAQRRMGDGKAVAASVRAAEAAFGSDVPDLKALVTVLLATDAYDRAMAKGVELVAAAPDDAEARDLLQKAITGCDRWGPPQDEALAACPALESADFSFNQAWRRAKSDDDLDRLIARCRATLEQTPYYTDARCVLAHALAQRGQDDAARAAMAPELVRIETLAPGEGYADNASFHAALAEEIRRNPTLQPDPKYRATRDGFQTSYLGFPEETAVAALIVRIREAVEHYVAALAGSSDPFVAPLAQVRMTQWAVIYGLGGHQNAHRHPSGWISGVYYVSAPQSASGNSRSALLVGAADSKLERETPPWGIRAIDPVPGRIVLFPSFVTHATEPSSVGGERISVAFDVMPGDASS